MRRRAEDATLASTFVSVTEPYQAAAQVVELRRFDLVTPNGSPCGEANVAVEALLADGRRDLLIALDVQNPPTRAPSAAGLQRVVQGEWGATFEGDLCLVRLGSGGNVVRVALCKARELLIGSLSISVTDGAEYAEVDFSSGSAKVVAGKPEDVTVTTGP